MVLFITNNYHYFQRKKFDKARAAYRIPGEGEGKVEVGRVES